MWAIPLITTLASGAYDWWKNSQLEDRIKQMEKDNVRPDYMIPESQKQALELARSQAEMSGVPGLAGIQGRLDNTTANTLSSIERLSDNPVTSLNAAARAYGNQLEQETNLGIKGAEMKFAAQDAYKNELGKMADFENMEWNWETGQPYLSKQSAIAALKGAELANENTMIKDVIGGFGNTAMAAYWNDFYKKNAGTTAYRTPNSNPNAAADFKRLYDKMLETGGFN